MRSIFLAILVLVSSSAALAASSSALFILDRNQKINAQELYDRGDLSYSSDRNTKFCYEGSIDQVVRKIREWNAEGEFYSGGGGGYVIEQLKVTRTGIVGPKINLVIQSEVTGETESTIFIIRCKRD